MLPGNDTIAEAHHVPFAIKVLPIAVGFAGIALAYLAYVLIPGLPGAVSGALRPIHALFYRKWFFDELYDAIAVRPSLRFGRRLWKSGDGAVIDGLGPDGLAKVTLNIARRAGQLQTGYLYHYAFVMLIGVAALVSWYLFTLAG